MEIHPSTRFGRRPRNNYFVWLFVAALVVLSLVRSSYLGGLAGRIFTVLPEGGEYSLLDLVFSRSATLLEENRSLRKVLAGLEAKVALSEIMASENSELRRALGRDSTYPALSGSTSKQLVVARTLSIANDNIYGALRIDAGLKQGVVSGNLVVVSPGVLIGTVDTVYEESAIVKLLSAPGEITRGVFNNDGAAVDLSGRGGGAFSVELPRDMHVIEGDKVYFLSSPPWLIASVRHVLVDPAKSTKTVLISAPTNIQYVREVYVVKSQF